MNILSELPNAFNKASPQIRDELTYLRQMCQVQDAICRRNRHEQSYWLRAARQTYAMAQLLHGADISGTLESSWASLAEMRKVTS